MGLGKLKGRPNKQQMQIVLQEAPELKEVELGSEEWENKAMESGRVVERAGDNAREVAGKAERNGSTEPVQANSNKL